MNDKKKAFNLRIPEDMKCKVEYLATQTNRSVNGMILEMIESYSVVGGGHNNFKGMSKDEYAAYLKSGVTYDDVTMFDFQISDNPNSYGHDEWHSTSCATDIGEVPGCYALIENDKILYVGASKNLKNRMKARKSNGWIASGNDKREILDYGMKLGIGASVMFWFSDNYKDMERDLIYSIDPKFNYHTPKHSGNSNFAVITKEWRDLLAERLGSNDSTKQEKKSINKLLSMRAYK